MPRHHVETYSTGAGTAVFEREKMKEGAPGMIGKRRCLPGPERQLSQAGAHRQHCEMMLILEEMEKMGFAMPAVSLSRERTTREAIMFCVSIVRDSCKMWRGVAQNQSPITRHQDLSGFQDSESRVGRHIPVDALFQPS